MNLEKVLVVLRHNTQLGGDLRLAKREFDALMNQSGQVVKDRTAISQVLTDLWYVSTIELSGNHTMVACLYTEVSEKKVDRLLRRSAFAQEVFIVDGRVGVSGLGTKQFSLPAHESAELFAGGTIVALPQAYVIESEAVLGSEVMNHRIALTVDLLLEPYRTRRLTARSVKVRRAKKTTLSLSHDLHIYKAKFFPRMVRALLNIFGDDNSSVLDPFCGSGTALLEASLLGLNSWGSDIDPICQLMSRTKVTPFVREAPLTESLRRFELTLTDRREPRPDFSFPNELLAKIKRRDRIDETQYLDEIVSESSDLASALTGLNREHPDEELFFMLASDAVTKKIRYRFIGVGNGKYTIEIVRQRLMERMHEKLQRSQQLAGVFSEIQGLLDTRLGKVTAIRGDARDRLTWPRQRDVQVIITSPPYLPASSGREHYASSRALAFAVLGFQPGQNGYFDIADRDLEVAFNVAKYPEAARLMNYLESDANIDANPNTDAMRFERKAVPTRQYLKDIKYFFENVRASLADEGVLILVVAHQHVFYSHRRKELEHIVSGRALYSEIAADAGLVLSEEIKMELVKAVTSHARPMAKEEYYESVLIFRKSEISIPELVANSEIRGRAVSNATERAQPGASGV